MSEACDQWAQYRLNLDELLSSAQDPDPCLRWAAALELARCSDSRATETLRALLSDVDEDVRAAADAALRQLANEVSYERGRARVALQEHEEIQASRRRGSRRVKTHLEAETFDPWRIKRTPDPSSAETWVVETVLFDIVETEGPLLVERLLRLYRRGCEINGIKSVSTARITKALKSLIAKGRVVRSDDYRSDRVERWVVHECGSPGVVLRQRGTRELRDIPPGEVAAALQASVRRSRGVVDMNAAYEAIIAFYEMSPQEASHVGSLLLDEWSSLLI